MTRFVLFGSPHPGGNDILVNADQVTHVEQFQEASEGEPDACRLYLAVSDPECEEPNRNGKGWVRTGQVYVDVGGCLFTVGKALNASGLV